ncbi:MAG: hypothetical protein CFE21_02290 [Bacteroidetes bacterium B1(2017)]|nr:MAG: hypothetical protein CFE21_02290 [Bacteroidetes bacterium B1(2017)]
MNQNAAQAILFTEHTNWLRMIDQTKSQYKDLQNRLERALPQFDHTALMARVEQFQNRFIRHREVIDELRHEIKQHENHLQQLDQPNHLLLLTHINLRDQFNRFYDLYIELERDFDEFLA